MDLDLKKLRNGDVVFCPLCNKGTLKPEFGVSPDTATHFECTNCKEQLILNIRMPSKTDKPAQK